MLKRFLLALLAVAATALGSGQRALVNADSLGEDPGTSPGWEGLPDTDRFSGRFLTLTGDKNESVPGGDTDAARNLIRLTFTPALPTDKIRIAVFDGDTGGFWDQHVDGVFVVNKPDSDFDLFIDPDGTARANLGVLTPDVTLKASTITQDRDWCVLLDDVASNWESAKGSDGRYHFLLRSTLKPAAGKQLSGYELNGYKLAFNGTYLLPAGEILGFIGGAVDTYIQFQGGPGFALTNDPLPDGEINTYAGVFDFPFNPASFCADLEFYNADADWNDDTGLGADVVQTPLSTPPLTGVPPDNGRPFSNPQVNADITNIVFKVGAPVQFEIRDPDPTNVLKFSSLADLAEKRPSRNVAYDKLLTGQDFQKVVLAKSMFGPPVAGARWKLRWTGLDLRNSTFIKFNQDFGTTERQPLFKGWVFCDDDKDGKKGQGEEGLAGVDVEIRTAQGAVVTTLTTDEFGFFSSKLALGAFTATVTSELCWQPRFDEPVRFTTDLCEDTEVLFPYDCTGSVHGTIFCDVAPLGQFGLGDTALGLPATIVLERMDGQTVLETVEVAVPGNQTAFHADGLEPGTWRVKVKADPAIDLLTKTTLQPQTVVLDGQTCRGDVTFGYQCAVNVCARLFCDKDGDCLFTPSPEGQDEPLPGVLVNAVSKPPLPPLTVPGVTDANGQVCFKLPAGLWDLVVVPGQNVLNGTKLKSAPVNPILVAQQDLDFLFCYECVGSICGTVYLNQTDCDRDYDLGVDKPFEGVQVNLYAFPRLPAALPIDTTTTDSFGGYCFLDLDPAQYQVEVALSAGNTLILGEYFATQPTVRTPIVLAGEVVDKQDFGYCELGRIYGRVFRENGANDCDGIWQEDDTPIEGVLVSLVGTDPVRPPQVFLTLADGTYDFPNLQPGKYSVSVNGAQPKLVVLAPGSALTVPVTLLAGDQVEVDFPFCPGTICGTVYKNDPQVGCDEDYDLGFDLPLAGVTVQLWKSPLLPPAFPALRSTQTLIDGSYCFKDLDAGLYQVRVGTNPPQAILLGLTPTAPVVRSPLLVAGGKVLNQDFGYCEPGCIQGTVFRDNGTPDCDGVWTDGDDTPIAGVLVNLVGTNPVRPPTFVLTDANGFYKFPNLQPGVYAVSVNGQQPKLVVLTPSTPVNVPATVVGGEAVVVDFGFCSGKICGTVYKNDPQVGCDGDYDIGFDLPLAGVTVQLWKSPLLPPLHPPLRTTQTLIDGSYCFLDLDAGIYQVRVGTNPPQVILLGLSPTAPVVRNPVLVAGGAVLNQDFGYCEPGCIQGTVFRDNGQPDCDGVWTEGDDTPIAGVTVRLVGTVPVRPPALAVTGADGGYKFPNLPAGQYTVSVNGGQPQLIVLSPAGALSVPATVLGGDVVVVDFGFCSGKICGTVYLNPAEDCDESYDPSQGDLGLANVEVSLWVAPNGPPSAPYRTTSTLPDGSYCFTDLDAGLYRVRVAGQQDGGELLNLTPTQPVQRLPQLLPGNAVLHQDFGYCEPLGRIYGYVFKNPTCTCDDVLNAGDQRIPGVTVYLTRFVEDMAILSQDVTDANGFYEFGGLPAGQYLVEIDGLDPQLVDLSPSTPEQVGPFALPPGGAERVDFGYCEQRACGFVFREPACACDGVFNGDDQPVEGVLVRIDRVSGEPWSAETLTGPDGQYCFERVPEGVYEITIPEGQPALAGLEASSDAVRTATVRKGQCKFDLNFGFCPPEKQRLCVKVFCEPAGTCDGVFDEGRDLLMEWVEVFAARASAPTVPVATGITDSYGLVCFEELEAGSWIVVVNQNQAALRGYKPSTKTCVCVDLAPCEEEWVCVGFCKDCKPGPCCEGDLREVLVGTSFWVGDGACNFDLKAKLLAGCDGHEIDSVCRTWTRTFGTPLVGVNEILEVADVKVAYGVAYVVLRVKAGAEWFEDGVFGTGALKFVVTLNGVTNKGCATLRCESFRPGQYFQYAKGLCLPDCECAWRWDGRSAWDAPWVCYPSQYSVRFIVLDTYSQREWECTPLLVAAK